LYAIDGALMASRLRMTAADYLAIAVSPALIMCLVGSLVFFLIEVVYVGDYQARISYVFAWLVFATVLIARISIEMGSERAALYSIPLALAVFVVLQTFVEHSTVFSPLINIALIVLVWWCSHRLTWDCTVIDDNRDATGEGLLEQVGLDDEDAAPVARPARNELAPEEDKTAGWRRWITGEGGPHTPGLWVLYLSLAALPLFGLGQYFIPAGDVGSRRYAFALLFVYVAAGLSLLVTTSFLGFRRYLRQRQVEMPAPMAVTWIGIGGTLILIIMLLAALLPRPQAEYAISKLPWQMRSPQDLEPSRYGVGPDGVETEEAERTRSSDEPNAETIDSPEGKEPGGDAEGESSSQGEESSQSGESSTGESSDQPGEQGESQQGEDGGESSEAGSEGQTESGSEAGQQESRPGEGTGEGTPGEDEQGEGAGDNSNEPASQEAPTESPDSEGEPGESAASDTDDPAAPSKPGAQGMFDHSQVPQPTQVLQQASWLMGGLFGLIKWIFYLALAALLLYLGWKYRRELWAALGDIIRDIRAWLARLLGGSPSEASTSDEPVAKPAAPRRSFRQYRNPFEQRGAKPMNPAELVVYTFEAMEAWASDRGQPRGPEQTPQEFVRNVFDPSDPGYESARQLASLYNRLAYGGGGITAAEGEELRTVWNHMLSAAPVLPRAG
jgi:hypothetical protein